MCYYTKTIICFTVYVIDRIKPKIILLDYGIATGNQLLEFPCAFVYNSSESGRGVVTSPNYPGLYPRDTECNYFFYGNKFEKVHLHFKYFDVEGVVP